MRKRSGQKIKERRWGGEKVEFGWKGGMESRKVRWSEEMQ